MFGNLGLAALLTIHIFLLAATLVALGILLVLLGLPLAAGALILAAVVGCTVAFSLPPPGIPLALDLSQSHRSAPAW